VSRNEKFPYLCSYDIIFQWRLSSRRRGGFRGSRDDRGVGNKSGYIELKLFCDVAPKACENFIGSVNKGYYEGVIFHRVIKGFMIQGGDPIGTGMGGVNLFSASLFLMKCALT
jgi:hypothetical protein